MQLFATNSHKYLRYGSYCTCISIYKYQTQLHLNHRTFLLPVHVLQICKIFVRVQSRQYCTGNRRTDKTDAHNDTGFRKA